MPELVDRLGLSYVARMKLAAITAVLVWVAASMFSLAGSHGLMGGHQCGDMKMMAMAHDNSGDHHAMMDGHDHGPAMSHDGHAGMAHDCSDTCCDGACLCKAFCGGFSALIPGGQGPDAISELHSITRLASDILIEALHLLFDPPPRS